MILATHLATLLLWAILLLEKFKNNALVAIFLIIFCIKIAWVTS